MSAVFYLAVFPTRISSLSTRTAPPSRPLIQLTTKLEEINVASSASASASAASAAVSVSPLQAFDQWLNERQVVRHKVEITQVQDDNGNVMRGLIATQDISPGEAVIQVPLSATLRLKGGNAELDQDDNWAGALAATLLQQDSTTTHQHWGPYLETLPQEAPNTPCRWTTAERRQLQNETMMQVIDENAAWRQRQAKRWIKRPQMEQQQPSSQQETIQFYKYLDLVCSRTLKGRDGSRQLVPLIDMANHAPAEAGGGAFVVDVVGNGNGKNNNNKEDHQEEGYVTLLAGHKGIAKGHAVTLDYGARTVDDFLLHYGFVPSRCASDSVQVTVAPTSTAGATIGTLNDEERLQTKTIRWNDLNEQGGRGNPHLLFLHNQQEEQQDEQRALENACAQRLSMFPTTLQQDVQILNDHDGELTEPQQLALLYRYAKKSLLTAASGKMQYYGS